jgi:hypothetical protein
METECYLQGKYFYFLILWRWASDWKFKAVYRKLYDATRTLSESTRSFKYDRDYLCVKKSQFVPVIFEPPCTRSKMRPELTRQISLQPWSQIWTGTLHGESLPYAVWISGRLTIILPLSRLSTSARPPHNHVTTFRVLPYTTLPFRCLLLLDTNESLPQSGVRITQHAGNFGQLHFSYGKTGGKKCNFCVALKWVVMSIFFRTIITFSSHSRPTARISCVFIIVAPAAMSALHAWHA